jgi:hypothetical protein
MFIGFYLAFSGRVGRRKGGFVRAFFFFLLLAALAFGVNLSFWNVSEGTIDMFFVGPAKMNVVVYSEIGEIIGRPAVTALYIVTFSLASWLCYAIFKSRKHTSSSITRSFVKI